MVVSPEQLRVAREAKGWSQGKLADEARKLAEHDGHPGKLTQQSIGSYERGKAKREPTWMRYVMAALEGATAPIRSEVESAGIIGSEVHQQRFGTSPLPPLPHYGTGLGGAYGDLDDNIELTELHAFQVIEHLARPASLATDKDAYVITIVGDSMVPRFRPRERVTVSPRASISLGDWVVVQLKGAEGEQERVTTVLVKELVRRSASFIELKQYNPETAFRIETKRVAAMHKVLGDYY